MLKEIAGHLIKGGLDEVSALKCVLSNWFEFAEYAEEVYGVFNPPIVPTVKYLTRALAAIGNFYVEKKEYEEEKEKEEFEQFQRQIILSHPEVREAVEFWEAHKKRRDLPACGWREMGWTMWTDPETGDFIQPEGLPTPKEIWQLADDAHHENFQDLVREHNLLEIAREEWARKSGKCN